MQCLTARPKVCCLYHEINATLQRDLRIGDSILVLFCMLEYKNDLNEMKWTRGSEDILKRCKFWQIKCQIYASAIFEKNVFWQTFQNQRLLNLFKIGRYFLFWHKDLWRISCSLNIRILAYIYFKQNPRSWSLFSIPILEQKKKAMTLQQYKNVFQSTHRIILGNRKKSFNPDDIGPREAQHSSFQSKKLTEESIACSH